LVTFLLMIWWEALLPLQELEMFKTITSAIRAHTDQTTYMRREHISN
jgi:hypothetical protein